MGCLEAGSLRGGWAGYRHRGGTGARPQALGTGEAAAEAGQLRRGSCLHREALFSDPTEAFGLINFSAKQVLSFRFQGAWPQLLRPIYCLKTSQSPRRRRALVRYSDSRAGTGNM